MTVESQIFYTNLEIFKLHNLHNQNNLFFINNCLLFQVQITHGNRNIHTWQQKHSHMETQTFFHGNRNIHTWKQEHIGHLSYRKL